MDTPLSERPNALADRPVTFSGNLSPSCLKSSSLASCSRQQTSKGIYTLLQNISSKDRQLYDQGIASRRCRSRLEDRQIHDKSYFMGLLHRKGYDIGTEIRKMQCQIDSMRLDQSMYTSYKKKAATAALELKDLQTKHSDFNTVNDWSNVEVGIEESENSLTKLRSENRQAEEETAELFEKRKEKEVLVAELETDLSQDSHIKHILSSTACNEVDNGSKNLKKASESLKATLIEQNKELKQLILKTKQLENRCDTANKKEAHDLLIELKKAADCRDITHQALTLSTEIEPFHRRKKDLSDVLKCFQKETRSIKSEIFEIQSGLKQSFIDVNNSNSDRMLTISKLKHREEILEKFFDMFPDKQNTLLNEVSHLQSEIKLKLANISRKQSYVCYDTGTPQKTIKEKLLNSLQSAELKQLNYKLSDLESLDIMTAEELKALKEKIAFFHEKIPTFSNVTEFKSILEQKAKSTKEKLKDCIKQRDIHRFIVEDLQEHYDAEKRKLDNNTVYMELTKLEKRWHCIQKENFELERLVNESKMLYNYLPTKQNVMETVISLNVML